MAASRRKFELLDRVAWIKDPRKCGEIVSYCGWGLYAVQRGGRGTVDVVHSRFLKHESLLVALAKAAL